MQSYSFHCHTYFLYEALLQGLSTPEDNEGDAGLWALKFAQKRANEGAAVKQC
jgi:hypothetical protein